VLFAGLNPDKLFEMETRQTSLPAALLGHVDERLHFDGAGPAFPPAQ